MKYYVIGTYRESASRPDSPIAGLVLSKPFLGHCAYPVLALKMLADQELLWVGETRIEIRWCDERKGFVLPEILESLPIFEPRAHSGEVIYYDVRLA